MEGSFAGNVAGCLVTYYYVLFRVVKGNWSDELLRHSDRLHVNVYCILGSGNV